jgi:hypothetical protein
MQLTFPIDRGLRQRYFTKSSFAHPAKLDLHTLLWLCERYTSPGETIADPMAGVGSLSYLALLQRNVILREIEPKWLKMAHENAAQIIEAAGLFAGAINIGQADAREAWDFQADHLIFSPPYGCEASRNRFRRQGILSHKHRLLAERPEKLGKRWRILLEREQTQPGAAGSIQFHYGDHPAQIGHLRNARYWEAMEKIYGHALAALRPGGTMSLIIKDHIKAGQRVRVADETVKCCEGIGFFLVDRHERTLPALSLWQRRRKEQGLPVVDFEDILVFGVPS